MIPWTPFERRWRDALLAALIPPADAEWPGLGGIQGAGFWEEYRQAAPWLLRAGFRLAVWLLTWLPPVTGHRRPFHRLDPEAQDRVLRWAMDHPSYWLRQLTFVVKLNGCFLYLRDPVVRAAADGGRGR